MSKTVLQVSQEMDKLLNSPESTKHEIETKRKELHKAAYDEYIAGLEDPRD